MIAAAHWAWYGGWTPYGVGDHFVTGEFGVVGFDASKALTAAVSCMSP